MASPAAEEDTNDGHTVSAGPIVPVNREHTEPSKPLTTACTRHITSGLGSFKTILNPIYSTTQKCHSMQSSRVYNIAKSSGTVSALLMRCKKFNVHWEQEGPLCGFHHVNSDTRRVPVRL